MPDPIDAFPPDPAAPARPALTDWWCLRCMVDGRFAMTSMAFNDDGHFELAGCPLLFFDEADAEREAVKHRETFPWLMIEAQRLPISPPAVCLPQRHDDKTVIATQTVISRGGQSVQVEVRSTTLNEFAELAADLLGQVLSEAHAIPHTRVGPVKVITLGPRPVQLTGPLVDLADHDADASDTKEAA